MEFKLISIASLIAFYGCYFVKMFCQKRQGIQTDQIGKNKICRDYYENFRYSCFYSGTCQYLP